GWPQAHEDDAQRAVHAGLGIVEAMGALNARLEQEKGIRLAVRIGIHTGLVVVGEIGQGISQEHLALGETPNVASRIEGMAEPDTVIISDATYQLVQGYFVCDDLGQQALKGVGDSQQVYRVMGASGAQSRLDVGAAKGLTPLVGREQEVGLLLERWQQVKDGQSQVVLLSGEAGIGKSRLLQVMKDHVAGEANMLLECRSSPYYENTALYPITDMLQRILMWQQDDTPQAKLDKLEQTLRRYRLELKEAVPLFAPLLSLSVPEDQYPPLNLSPQQQRQKTLESIAAILLEQAQPQTVVFILEDLHWTDPTTLELLDILIDQAPTASILTLLTCRPTFQPTWSPRSYLTQVTLNRLSRNQIERMSEQVTGGKSLPGEVLQQIVEKTDGVPLFVEEMTKAILESGHLEKADGHYALTGPLPSLAIPATLQDSLMARLDRLVSAKGIAQLGAVLGRQFSSDLLRAVSQLDAATLQRELHRLVEAELLYQRGLPPQATYIFKHALIQETAYQSLLKSTRQQYHHRVAQVLATQFAATAETQPELLAYHYTEAGLSEEAFGYWQQAGQRASERSAYVEAIAHLNKGLEVLKTLPDTPARAQRELDLHTILGPALTNTKGPGAPEVERVYARARELCQHVGDAPQLFPVLWGLWSFYLARGEFQTAREIGEQLVSLGEHLQDPALLSPAKRALGNTLLWLGEMAPACTHLEQGIAVYDAQQHRSLAYQYGQDPAVVCGSWASWARWLLGYPEQALVRINDALAYAQELAHPLSLAYALNGAAWLHQWRHEEHLAQERAEAGIALCTEQGFVIYLAWISVIRGWTVAKQGQAAAGITQMRQGLAAWQATGTKAAQPQMLALLAETYGHVAQPEEGLTCLREAWMVGAATGERLYEAELYRLKGELLLQLSSDNQAEAEASFHQALDIARHQQAKSWELRAATSLARLWQSQDKRQDAYDLLAPVYGWFTEGFDTADLQEAKGLLEQVSSS
ncbi:MAG: AAA family ATPase, partial [bacterium]|nr:AAA family ATPase [bacterium]